MSHTSCAVCAFTSACLVHGTRCRPRSRILKPLHRHGVARLTACAFAATATVLLAAPAIAAGCNSGNVANSDLLSSANCQANAGGFGATAVGPSAAAGGSQSTAIGFYAVGSARDSTAIGAGANAPGMNTTAVGASSGPQNAVAGATLLGTVAGYRGAGSYATGIGAGNTIFDGPLPSGAYSVAIGGGDGAVFTPTIGAAINLKGAQATGYISLAIGTASQATGGGSSAFGLGSQATANDSAAYGEFSKASGASSIAIGLFSHASAGSSIALGRQAKATKPQSVAIGLASIANVANTVSVGRSGKERRIMNVAAGKNLTDAVNVAQLKAAVAAVASGVSGLAAGVPVGPEPPAVSVRQVGLGKEKSTIDGMRRRLSQLEALVERQQQLIAQLESRVVAAAK